MAVDTDIKASAPQPASPVPAAAPTKRPAAAAPEGERTLDDTAPLDGVAAGPTTCGNVVCELEDRGRKWAGLTNYECPRCGFATVSEDTARSRNPKHFA